MRGVNQLGRPKAKASQTSWGTDGSTQKAACYQSVHGQQHQVLYYTRWLSCPTPFYVVETKQEADVASQEACTGRAEKVNRFVFVSHPLTSVASLKITFERNYGRFKMTSEFSVVESCKNTRKGWVLSCVCNFPSCITHLLRRKPQIHTHTHTCWVCISTHVLVGSFQQLQLNKGLQCVMRDMTLLEYIATSCCVYSFQVAQCGWRWD